MTTCTNCKTEINQNYCPQCGQASKLKRIDAHYIQHEIAHVLHLEKGIFFTIRELLLRPGKNVREYISVNRTKLVKPIIFLIVCSVIYTMISHFFHTEEVYALPAEAKKRASAAISGWVESHYGYANIIMGIFIALWLKLFFKKHSYNFFEIIILLCFVMGMGMLILAVFAIIEGIVKVHLLQIAGFIAFIYCSWAIAQFFDEKKIGSYLKAFSAYILGAITFTLSVQLLGFAIDSIFKH
ncbi:MAG: DUF3667 domain-containing protein [Bacteroidota bacterium]